MVFIKLITDKRNTTFSDLSTKRSLKSSRGFKMLKVYYCTWNTWATVSSMHNPPDLIRKRKCGCNKRLYLTPKHGIAKLISKLLQIHPKDGAIVAFSIQKRCTIVRNFCWHNLTPLYREAESYVSCHQTSKHQCTCLGSGPNLSVYNFTPESYSDYDITVVFDTGRSKLNRNKG